MSPKTAEQQQHTKGPSPQPSPEKGEGVKGVPSLPSGEGGRRPGEGKTGWPGPHSVAFFEEEQGYIAPGIQSIALLSKLTIEKGEGARLTDADGNSYLD